MDCGVPGHEKLFNPNDTTVYFIFDAIWRFQFWYAPIHKFLSLFICVVGIMANLIHISILTRPAMKRSTVNRLLAFMACCDMVKMLTYLIYMLFFQLFPQGADLIDEYGSLRRGYAFPWIVFLLSHIVLSIDLHSTSLYLTVCTAFIRFKAINQLQSRFMDPKIAWKIFAVVFLFVGILCIPTFLVHDVSTVGKGLYTVGLPRKDEWSCRLFMFNLWLTGMFFKGLPCCLMIVFSILLLYKLRQNTLKHEKIVSKESSISRSARSDRTTLLLVLLLVVFLITELPQGFLALVNGIYPSEIHQYIYTPLGDLLDLLSLINSNACIVLYPLISSQYRESFRLMVARARADIDSRSTRLGESTVHRTVKYQSVQRTEKGGVGTELSSPHSLSSSPSPPITAGNSTPVQL